MAFSGGVAVAYVFIHLIPELHNIAGTLAMVLIIGTITSYFYKFDELILSLLLAFLTGGILLNSIKEEIPTINQSQFWAFAAGAILIGVLLLLGL